MNKFIGKLTALLFLGLIVNGAMAANDTTLSIKKNIDFHEKKVKIFEGKLKYHLAQLELAQLELANLSKEKPKAVQGCDAALVAKLRGLLKKNCPTVLEEQSCYYDKKCPNHKDLTSYFAIDPEDWDECTEQTTGFENAFQKLKDSKCIPGGDYESYVKEVVGPWQKMK